MFHPSEVELASTTQLILADVERLKPTRVVFDSLSELRLLAGTALRYRRQILALKQFFATRDCTVVLLDDMTATDHDLQMQSIAHGVVRLEQLHPDYGAERRRLRVVKYRGVKFRGGYHDYVIHRGGLQVFPRLVAAEHRQLTTRAKLRSEIAELDALLGGGHRRRDEHAHRRRGRHRQIDAGGAVRRRRRGSRATRGALHLRREPGHAPDPLPRAGRRVSRTHVEAGTCHAATGRSRRADAGRVRACKSEPAVEERDAKVIVIDSLNGYLNAMPEERHLTIQLHELLMYLGQKSVATILIGAHQGLIGAQMTTPVDATYLADAVVLLRYFENKGEVRQAISVMKKRGSKHERTLRDFRLDGGCITIGAPLRDFRGVLTGVPVYEGVDTPGRGREGA